MHDTAHDLGRRFFETYVDRPDAVVMELGSYDVNGSLRGLAHAGWTWVGADIEAGPGVDVCVRPAEPLPFRTGSFDVVVASSVFEHDPCFWVTFLELARVLKPGGLLYINVPSNGPFHRYPIDCWRFYPDAGGALQSWARRNGLPLSLQESFVAPRRGDVWNDFVAVFSRGEAAAIYPKPDLATQVNARNVARHGEADLSALAVLTEDAERLANAEAQIQALQAQADQGEPEFSEEIDSQAELSALRGHLDTVDRKRAAGWVCSLLRPRARLLIQVRLKDKIVAQGLASSYRPDVAAAGVGTGWCGFHLPLKLGAAKLHEIEVRVLAPGPSRRWLVLTAEGLAAEQPT